MNPRSKSWKRDGFDLTVANYWQGLGFCPWGVKYQEGHPIATTEVIGKTINLGFIQVTFYKRVFHPPAPDLIAFMHAKHTVRADRTRSA